MNNIRHRIAATGICRPDGAGPVGGPRAIKIPLRMELVGVNDVASLKQLR